ncbi:zf-HC2 domain-containing protein [Saccharomonospora saliphila]|uniref:zf-HC2 domain-containing protein n=1 Tax=Saccharomonospora saliphila TaxID=369829 RepID=UPI00036FFD2D|nr:zf-HC2 domain-containing protein [Saccharomonospora saliphila]
MTLNRGWGVPESHLLPDVVVAFVDQELSLGAQERAAAHLAHCPSCAAEVSAQRAASSAVRGAETPSISAGFLANLRAIPQQTDLPSMPDNLAVGSDGQIVAVQRPDRVAGLRDGLGDGALGTSAPLGTAPTVLGNGPRLGAARRRATQGAGVVVSGLVLSALAFVATSSVGGGGADTENDGEAPGPPASGVWRAQFGAQGGVAATPRTPAASSTQASSTRASTAPPSTSAGGPHSGGPAMPSPASSPGPSSSTSASPSTTGSPDTAASEALTAPVHGPR